MDGNNWLSFEEFLRLGSRLAVSLKVIDSIPLEEVHAIESQELESGQMQLSILTDEGGRNRGRVYVYNLSYEEGKKWVSLLSSAVAEVSACQNRL